MPTTHINPTKITGDVLNDQFEMLNSVADLQDIEVPIGKRSFKNLNNKEKAHLNTCLTSEVISNFVNEIEINSKRHKRAMNTLITLVSKCESPEQLKLLTEMPVFKRWQERVCDAGLLGDPTDEGDDSDCDCPDCVAFQQELHSD